MPGRLETAKNYLASVAERTVGIDAYKRWQRHVAGLDNPPTDSIKQNRKGAGVFVGSIQLSFPGFTEGVARMWTEGFEQKTEKHPALSAFKYSAKASLDIVFWNLVLTASHNPLELVAWKLAANAATHVALDLGGEAVKRIKTFRPSATTLAV